MIVFLGPFWVVAIAAFILYLRDQTQKGIKDRCPYCICEVDEQATRCPSCSTEITPVSRKDIAARIGKKNGPAEESDYWTLAFIASSIILVLIFTLG